MRTILISTFALFLSVFTYSQTQSVNPKVIVNPSYEVKSSGIYNIAKIELSDTETRLTIHCTFIPGWWVSFSKEDDFIRDPEFGKTYQITGIEGGELDKHISMPASGDSTVVLIYPPLDKSVKKIDFGKSVYGISLDESKAGKKGPSVIPAQVTKCLGQELAKVKNKVPIDYSSPKFFSKGTGRLVGYIKGYDRRLGFNTALVYSSNELTREDFPTVVKIYPDGRFEADLPFDYPKYKYLVIENTLINFYLEPGQTLSMIIDWEEFLTADRKRNIRYQFQNIVYQGPLAKINTDLAGYTPEQYNYEAFQKKQTTMLPEDFKRGQMLVLKADMQKVEEYINSKTLTPQATAILRSKTLLESADHLFDFVMNRTYYSMQDTANKILKVPVVISYYDFLKAIPFNDKSLLVTSEFSTFVNRFEFCEPLNATPSKKSNKFLNPKKDFFTYLIEENAKISDEDKELIGLIQKKEKTADEKRVLESKKDQVNTLYERNKDLAQAYSEKYIKPIQRSSLAAFYKENWRLKDSILRSDLGLESSLVYEITKVRSLKFIFDASSREAASSFWEYLKPGIANPFLIETGTHLFTQSFPEKKLLAYPLPKGTATDVFRKITDPFKGKILFIDFWATTCGPCVAGIKNMKPNREKYKDNKDFDFIFITDERSSPKADYDKFVAEQGMKNIYRLPVDDYNYLRQLFKFNGIPHYTVIDRQGNVLSNNFSMHNFESELKRILSEN